MWQTLLAPFKRFGLWLLTFFINRLIDKMKDRVLDQVEQGKRAEEAKQILAELEELNKITPQTEEEKNALRDKKIALEEALLNSLGDSDSN